MIVQGIAPEHIEVGSVIRLLDDPDKPLAIVTEFDHPEESYCKDYHPSQGPVGIIIKWVGDAYTEVYPTEYVYLRNEKTDLSWNDEWFNWEITNWRLIDNTKTREEREGFNV